MPGANRRFLIWLLAGTATVITNKVLTSFYVTIPGGADDIKKSTTKRLSVLELGVNTTVDM